MIIQRIFSEKEDNNLKGAGLLAGSLAVGKGGTMLGEEARKKSESYLLNSELTAKDKKAIKRKLKNKAKEQGIKIINDPKFSNSAYTGSKYGKTVRNNVSIIAKKLRKLGKNKDAENLLEAIEEGAGSKQIWKNLGKDKIVLGEGILADTDILSHELGHAQYERSGRSKSMIGKAAHKLMPTSKIISSSKAGKGAIFAHGLQAGMKKEKNNREGKETKTWDKVRSVAVPAALVSPILIAEGKASLNGLKTMKQMGASKKLIKQSRKRLGAAYGTYAGDASKPIFIGASGELAGRGVSKILYSKDKDKKDL